MHNTGMEQVTIELDEKQLERLHQAKLKTGLSVSDFLLRAVNKTLYERPSTKKVARINKIKARSRKISDLIRQTGLTCGAWSRNSQAPCKQPPISLNTGNGRCRYHGGLSTGPTSAEGRARMLLGASLGGRTTNNRYQQAQAQQQALNAQPAGGHHAQHPGQQAAEAVRQLARPVG